MSKVAYPYENISKVVDIPVEILLLTIYPGL
jgi:hypothetical protein